MRQGCAEMILWCGDYVGKGSADGINGRCRDPMYVNCLERVPRGA
jgi:hypothetical protein